MQAIRSLTLLFTGFLSLVAVASPSLKKLLRQVPNGESISASALTANEVFVNVDKTCLILRHNNTIELFDGPRSRLRSLGTGDLVAQAFGQSTYEKASVRLSVSPRTAYARLLDRRGKVEKSLCQARRY